MITFASLIILAIALHAVWSEYFGPNSYGDYQVTVFKFPEIWIEL
jgi:hypothetical protein